MGLTIACTFWPVRPTRGRCDIKTHRNAPLPRTPRLILRDTRSANATIWRVLDISVNAGNKKTRLSMTVMRPQELHVRLRQIE
jgi:hypothetical protein